MKQCPYCAEDIQDAAVICRHCHQSLALSMRVSPAMAALVIVVAVVVLVGYALVMNDDAAFLFIDSWLRR